MPYDPDDGRGDIWWSALSDEPPTSEVITATGGILYSFYKAVKLDFPSSAVVTDTLVTYTPAGSPPTGLLSPVRIFDLTAERFSDGSPVTSFNEPFTLTVSYTHAELKSAIESTLQIYYWSGSQWVAETTSLDITNNLATAHPDHMSYFALMGNTNRVYLPVCIK